MNVILSLTATSTNQTATVEHSIYFNYKCVRVGWLLVGCSRGPSPLTMGAQDTLPVAAAFTETVNTFFKGADPNK